MEVKQNQIRTNSAPPNKVIWEESSLVGKFSGRKVLGRNVVGRKVLGRKVPWEESSLGGKFLGGVPGRKVMGGKFFGGKVLPPSDSATQITPRYRFWRVQFEFSRLRGRGLNDQGEVKTAAQVQSAIGKSFP